MLKGPAEAGVARALSISEEKTALGGEQNLTISTFAWFSSAKIPADPGCPVEDSSEAPVAPWIAMSRHSGSSWMQQSPHNVATGARPGPTGGWHETNIGW